jgi:tetratricopeptide (TPR) repeat protein
LLAAAILAEVGARPGTCGSAGGRMIAGLLILALFSVMPATLAELRSRASYDEALDALGRRDGAAFLAALERCGELVPDHPYPAHLRAGFLATGQPLGAAMSGPARDEAADLLAASVARNPYLEYAWYNLGWLRLPGDPADAERCFAAAAGLAPHRLGVHLGLGLARAARGDAAGAVAAFAAERVNAPEQAFAPLLRGPGLADVAAEVERAAEAFLSSEAGAGRLPAEGVATVLRFWRETPADAVREGPAVFRVRPGYGVLMGFPEGRPPADVQPLSVPVLPAAAPRLPRPGWVPGTALLRLARVDPPPRR